MNLALLYPTHLLTKLSAFQRPDQSPRQLCSDGFGINPSHSDQTAQQVPSKTFPLSMASAGESLVITEIRGGNSLYERLLAMGIGCNDTVEIVHRQDHGGVVVAKNGTRYALGGGMAQKIFVARK